MERHYRILGSLFILWGVLQLVFLLIAFYAPELVRTQPGAPYTAIAIGVTVAVGAFYVFTGWALLRKQPWVRMVAIAASVLALFSFPFGTALGIYGLWVMFFLHGRQTTRPYGPYRVD